jgi:hypothetical protein
MSAERLVWNADSEVEKSSQAQSSARSSVVDGILIRMATD